MKTLRMASGTARAYVQDDDWGRGVKVAFIAQNPVYGDQILCFNDVVVTTLEEGTVAPEEGFLRLPMDMARALYESLAEHFGHTTADASRVVKELEHEKRRVDKFIDHVIGASK